MKRLFAFGCSFTYYSWPTWADFLGLEFDDYQNWGYQGIGNRAIAERVAECVVENNIGPDDVVIVQWTSHLRHDYHINRRRLNYSKTNPFTLQDGWKTGGSIFNWINQKQYDNEWIKNFFDEKSYLMHSLNHIRLTQGLLESTGCRWLMTSMSRFDALGRDVPENQNAEMLEERNDSYSFWADENYEKLWKYKKIWDEYEQNWLTPIGPFCWDRDNDWYWQAATDPSPWKELHPSPRAHIEYVDQVIKPKLGLGSKQDLYSNLVELSDRARRDSNKDLLLFCNIIQSQWQNKYQGI